MSEAEFSPLQLIKRRFFAMRNGIIADTMRKAGATYRIIFGLNLPQLKEIVAEFQPMATELAPQLWQNASTRESRLTAVMLFSTFTTDAPKAEELIASLSDDETEVSDLIVMKLLKGAPHFDSTLEKLLQSQRQIDRYTALRMAYSLVDDDSTRPRALAIARQEIARGDQATLSLARQLEYDADW
ncbi:MAG: DNA alkylation repair protein [Muribaculaceae bacterium]|nr:DNA alkylation repair protein [Muribaculaceae bacterium]MDE5967968.1 DNA alkylation repair protein [Muribaculaceae bacterium]